MGAASCARTDMDQVIMPNSRALFASTAWHYARFRSPYPDELFARIADRFHLDGTGRMLDVGCGTGQMCLPLRDRFDEIVAIDVSDEMVQEGRLAATGLGARNVTFLVLPGESVSEALGAFRLVTFGSSLHWMNADAVLRRCHDRLVRGGGIAQAGIHSIWGGASDWEVAVVRTVQKWLGEERRAGSGTYSGPTKPYEEIALADAGFSNIEAGEIRCEFTWDIDYIIGHLYSTSYCNKALLGDRAQDFEEDLRRTLYAINPGGQFVWRTDMNYILAGKL